MHSSDTDLAANAMRAARNKGGAAKKPPKVVKKIEYEKAADGSHVFTHHHTHPEHHPAETHHFKPKGGAEHHDEAMDHFIGHAVPPNPGEELEPEAEPGAGGEPAAAPGGPAGME